MNYDSPDFYKRFTYEGPLGWLFQDNTAVFRVWAPLADRMILRIYSQAEDLKAIQEIDLSYGEKGVWTWETDLGILHSFYTLEASYDGTPRGETPDPYAKAISPNGTRGYICKTTEDAPAQWETDQKPPFSHPCDAVIYELHIRDFSSSDHAHMKNKGKLLALTEEGTKTETGESTGLDHLLDLGITHLHLLPVFDFDDLDDLIDDPEIYNWGYNPRHYSCLKGAYSSDPKNPVQVIKDFKKAVQVLHKKGIRVVMDVVYNHTFASQDSHLNKIFPNYYYRKFGEHFSNGSGCGNELASERPMVRKMILDSLSYLATEFHLDGFRFDLMGLHDQITMNTIVQELRKIDPAILIYGEGWTGGLSTLPDEEKCLKRNAAKVREVAFFSDDARDAIKGHVFESSVKGFVNGGTDMEESVKFGVVASGRHPQVDYSKLLYSQEPWATAPHQAVNYFAAHDNHTLWDKLTVTNPDDPPETLQALHLLAASMVFTSQGIAFLHAGEEMLRTKKGEENSYRSPDHINSIDWTWKRRNKEAVEYYQGLIQLRKQHPAFRLRSQEQIISHLKFLDLGEPSMVGFILDNHAGGDASEKILVIFNANPRSREVHLPQADWHILVNHQKAGVRPLGTPKNFQVSLPAHSCMVLATDV